MTEVEQQPPPQNGIDLSAAEEDDSNKARPADIEQDMREMERRKRVEAIMGSKLFREELERIVDSARDGGGILQQLSDIMGVSTSTRVSNVFKATNCMLPINDIRGVESMGYAKGEKILRCKLAATFRLLDLYGWTQGLGAQITARLKVDQENFLVNPYGMMYHEITASSLNRVDMQGQVVEQGTTNFGVNKNHFALHSVVHAARPDIRCAIYIGCTPVVAVSSLKVGLLPLTRDACVLGEVTTHSYTGTQMDADERDRLVRALGPNSKVLILSNYGALCCGETIEEAFFAASHIVKACETQLQLLPVGVDNLVLIPEESRKAIFIDARRPPEDLEKKFAAAVATVEANAEAAAAADGDAAGGAAVAAKTAVGGAPKWRVGGAEFEALMRMLDNAGYRTGYIYRHPLIKSDPPKPKNDVELPPAVSSLGYLLEEEELLKQGIWKKGDFRKGGDRSRWLNSPNVYQKVEVLETGTPDPKKITKWVAEGSPTHSTPVRIEDPLQFVPAGTNPKEFKRLQQQIKDNRRADKISAGPQSHILEGVTWDEANRIKDATVSSAGDHVVLMGAASKGIIQRGYQHNAAVYKAPYAKNPFDNVTDDELNEYKRTVERKKKSIHGEYTDTDFSESEPLSSMPISAPQQTKQITITTAAVSQSEPEDVSEHQVMRIQTQQAPVPSQPEVVLSDATLSFINGERSHTAVNRRPPTGRDVDEAVYYSEEEEEYSSTPLYEKIDENISAPKRTGTNYNNNTYNQFLRMPTNDEANMNVVTSESPKELEHQSNKENIYCGNKNIKRNRALIAELKRDALFQRQKHKLEPNKNRTKECTVRQGTINNNRITPLKHSSSGAKSPTRVGDNSGEAAPTYNELLGGNVQQQHINVDSIGFRPIHPIVTSADTLETFTQQPQFRIADPNNNIGVGCQVAGGCAHHQHYRQYLQNHRQHAGPAVDIVTLPHFEQVFGHMLGRPANDLCDIYYDNYPSSYQPFYDRPQYADATHNASVVTTPGTTTDIDEADNPYKKSNACCTPAVCDSIFESLRQPPANDNNLIFNIPFTTESPDTTNLSVVSTPRKTRVDLPHKSTTNSGDGKGAQLSAATSPYRTLSHFGFNSPQRDPQPDHKHIPCVTEQKKYVPLRKSISYEEIFSSPRYVDLCENCFEKIVRLKPEIAQQTQMRLRNLCDLNGKGCAPGHSPSANCTGIMYQPGSDGMAYDYVEYASSDTTEDTVPPFSSQLEPVLEVVEEVEPDSFEDARTANKASALVRKTQTLERTPSNSSFIEKIMRLNYSEESADGNFAHVPHKVASSTNLTIELERAIMESSQHEQQQQLHQQENREAEKAVETNHYNTEIESDLEAPNIKNTHAVTGYAENEATDAAHRLSVTEIWEFMKWQDEADPTQQHSGVTTDTTDMSRNGAICLYYENARESTTKPHKMPEEADTFTDNTPLDSSGNDQHNTPGRGSASVSAVASTDSVNQDRRRSLMTREERSRRKLVFQELWEDHIFFLDGKDLNTLSDTESAIDGQQEQSAARAQIMHEIVADSDDSTSVGVEQEVTEQQNEGNELLVVQTVERNAMPSLKPTTSNGAAPQLNEAEVFNSRSVILKKCCSSTTLQTCLDCEEELEKVSKSETLMKLRTTAVRRFSINELSNTRKSKTEPEKAPQDGCESPSTSTATPSKSVWLPKSKKMSENHDRLTTAIQKASTPVRLSPSNEISERSIEPKTSHPLTPPQKAAYSLQKSCTENPKYCEAFASQANLSFKKSLPTGEMTEPQGTNPEKTSHLQTQQPLTETNHENQSISVTSSEKTKSIVKSFIAAAPISFSGKPLPLESKVLKTSPEQIRAVENDRPPTPKPPITKSKHRKLSTPEFQSKILESESKLAYDLASVGEESVSESDGDHSARTYDVASSQERLFFLEHQLANPTNVVAPGRMDIEADEICLTANCRNVEGVKEIETEVVLMQYITSEELEASDILINQPRMPNMERAKAGMALPTGDLKPKSDQNSDARSIPNVARVAQLTTEALKEPSSKVHATPIITKKPRKKTNVLPKSASNVASTSVQAAQRTAEELKLIYEPKVEEYVLFKQNIPSPTSRTPTTECDRDVANMARTLDMDEMEFAELLESEEHEDLTKLSEEFEELLLNVENLQLQPQTRELGGADTSVNEEKPDDNKIVDEMDSHLNAMERKILRKIRESQLNESDEIFDKIEATIRNKITTSQLELLIKEQSNNQTFEESKSSHSTFTASTPERFSSAYTTLVESVGDSFVSDQISGIPETNMDESVGVSEPSSSSNIGEAEADESSTLTPRGNIRHSTDSSSTQGEFSSSTTPPTITGKLRRSRSLTPSTRNCELSSPPPKLNKTTTPPQEIRKSLKSSRSSQSGVAMVGCKSKVGGGTSSRWPRSSISVPEIQTPKRNFILENIRNASIPRHNASGGGGGGGGLNSAVKRLQGNAQAIFCKNPFGQIKLLSSMSNSSLTSSTASSSRTVVKSSSSRTIKQESPRNSSTGVYTFQSKLVRGSPRFWVSLTQPTVKKLQTQKRNRRSQRQQHHQTKRIEARDSTGSLREYTDTELMDNEQEAPDEEVKGKKVGYDEEQAVESSKVECGIDEEGEVERVNSDAMKSQREQRESDVDSNVADRVSSGGVEHELAALGEQIEQIQPRLDSYRRKVRIFGDHVANCTRYMDDCIGVQNDIAEEQRQLREQMSLQQYAEHILCQVQTYSISETED